MTKSKVKICPFIKGQCQKVNCEVYEARLKRCTIPVIAYNLYRLVEVESQLLTQETPQEEESTDFGELHGQMTKLNMEELFG